MSDYYHFSLNYAIRRDAPDALKNALSALANRSLPDEADLLKLPVLVADYLRHPHPPKGLDGDGFTYRFSRTGIYFCEESPADPTHYIHVERTFHDDEFANGGMYFIYWLFQFAAEDGHLAVELLEVDLPTIYTRHGDDIITTNLAYNPEAHRQIAYQQTLLDNENPIIVEQSYRQSLVELLEGMKEMEKYW